MDELWRFAKICRVERVLVGAGSVLTSPSLFPLGTIAWLARPALIWGGTAVLRRQTQARSTGPRRDYHARAYRNHGLQQGFAEREKSGIAAMPRERSKRLGARGRVDTTPRLRSPSR